jgi:hypothetical protein
VIRGNPNGRIDHKPAVQPWLGYGSLCLTADLPSPGAYPSVSRIG